MQETIKQKLGEAERLLQLTLALGNDIALAISTEAQADALLAAAEDAYLSLGQNVNEATGLGCPGGWFECPDGSCVGSEADCKGGNESAASVEASLEDIGGEA